MSWKYVISDRNCQPGSNIEDFIKVVLATGYNFFTWNGIVYCIGLDKKFFETGIEVKDLQ